MSDKPIKAENKQGRQPTLGKAVRPYRSDGYVNVMNKYGTTQDNSEAYKFEREPLVPDMQLTTLYEGNGLFSKIIDTPAEEALKHGFDLNLNNDELDAFVEEALDDLEWEDKAATAIKWARLYGGAIIVMLIDDGKGLEEPVDWKRLRSIDELRVFERAVVQPDYTSLYMQDYGGEGKAQRTSRFGEPEFYYVNSMFGSFKVHESRCLVFRNGVLPEQISNTTYQMWGMPEYIRIRRALRETTTAHSDATKLLERSVQAIYSMKDLSQLLATDDGETNMLKRLQAIDMAKGILNTIAIDADGESYDFKTFQFSGVKDVIDATCNMLSALTNIPQTLLFGRSPSGMNATGESDLENYYNFVERIQKLMLKKNLRYLLDIIFRAGVVSKEILEEPDYKLTFNPLWSLSDSEQAQIDQQRAATAMAKAQATQIYVDMGALDPSEVRKKLASDDEYNVEDVIEEDDEDLLSALTGGDTAGEVESDLEAEEKNAEQAEQSVQQQTQPTPSVMDDAEPEVTPEGSDPSTVGVLVIRDGKVLTGIRKSDFYPYTIGGPGGHMEEGETPEQAAIRETQEEFGITPKDLVPIATRTGLAKEFGVPVYFVCTDFDGEVHCDDHSEMIAPQWSDLGALLRAVESNADNLFAPFADSFRVLNDFLVQEEAQQSEKPEENGLNKSGKGTIIIEKGETDDGPGNFGHEGRPGQVGGSAPSSGGSSGEEAKKSEVSGEGANDPPKGFASAQKAKRHYSKHVEKDGAKLYEGMTQDDYEAHAKEFLSKPCGGDIDGFATSEGKVVRYNKVTGEYASGYPGGDIKTCMVAKVNKSTGEVNLEASQKYFERRKAMEGVSDDGPEA